MSTKLAVITTEYLKDFTGKSFADIGIPMDYEIFIYDSFSNIGEVYDRIPGDIRGVVTSGAFAAETIKQAHPNTTRVINSFNTDETGLFRLLLELMRNGKFDPSRVYIDFFDLQGIDLENFMYSPQKVTIGELLIEYMRGMTLDGLLKVEKYCIDKHMELWRQGRIDVAVTRFSSIAQQLEDNGVPMRFAYPSLSHIKQVCLQTLQEMQIKQLRQNLLAVIEITIDGGGNRETANERLRNLERALMRFKKAYAYDFLLMPVESGFEVFTSRKVINELTGNYKGCHLQEYLRQDLKAAVSIGYGIGNNMYQARANAVTANREACLRKTGGSCLINENDEMVSQLDGTRRVIIKRDTYLSLKQTSKKSGLSPLTIQKIIAIAREMDGHRVTSQDVASKLGITRRSANRFLSALTKTRTAKVATAKNSTTKGRPERVYQISVPD